MKRTAVDTVTNNEQLVRLWIYDGDLPLSDAAATLIELYKAQAESARAQIADALARENTALRKLHEMQARNRMKKTNSFKWSEDGRLIPMPIDAPLSVGKSIVHEWVGSWVFLVGRVPEEWYGDLAARIDREIDRARSGSQRDGDAPADAVARHDAGGDGG